MIIKFGVELLKPNGHRILYRQKFNYRLKIYNFFHQLSKRFLFNPLIIGYSSQPEVNWASPSIGVYKGSTMLNEASHGFYGKRGEKGEYTVQQFYKAADLTDSFLVCKLLYMKKEQEVSSKESLNL